ncbi:MAG: hypothetical protein WCK42_05745 [Myxococcaceae bacterium]
MFLLNFPGKYEVEKAFNELETINGFMAENETKRIVPAFYTLPLLPMGSVIQDLFEKDNIAEWSRSISEFISLSTLLFEDRPLVEQKHLQREFIDYLNTLYLFQHEITRYVLKIHPGPSLLGIDNLIAQFRGRGIRIGVFDVFDPSLFPEQIKKYPNARILNPIIFGDPIKMSHGNTVIDIILRLAPEAEIVPISSDIKSYAKAMWEISDHLELDILNISRAFPEDPVTKSLDVSFKKALRVFSKDAIVVKALGNTGTDLFGALNHRRIQMGLGPVSNITSYDLHLIRELYGEGETNISNLELFALNRSLFSKDIALTATVPGSFLPVQERTLGVPAESVYSPSTDTFESGSSFAAPQITAWLALLLEARQNRYPLEPKVERRQAVYEEIRQKTKGGASSY